jgi:hypothetical protein
MGKAPCDLRRLRTDRSALFVRELSLVVVYGCEWKVEVDWWRPQLPSESESCPQLQLDILLLSEFEFGWRFRLLFQSEFQSSLQLGASKCPHMLRKKIRKSMHGPDPCAGRPFGVGAVMGAACPCS